MKPLEKIKLKRNERNGIDKAVTALTKLYPIKNIILFGSKARGKSDIYSDIDLLLICEQKLSWQEEKAIVELLFDIGIEFDIIFSPLFTMVNEWDGGIFKEFPIYNEIITDGVLVQ
jgi:uncharacterized protein